MKTVPTNVTSKNSWKKKRGRGYQYLIKWKNYVRFTWEPISILEDTVALDEFETNLNWGGGNVMVCVTVRTQDSAQSLTKHAD